MSEGDASCFAGVWPRKMEAGEAALPGTGPHEGQRFIESRHDGYLLLALAQVYRLVIRLSLALVAATAITSASGLLSSCRPDIALAQAGGVPGGSYAAQGRAKFTAKKYDEAIELFRKHLRRAPRDYSTWNQLGAAYYHTGQPRKALRYLKHVERRTIDKSYNYYYQGLCYTATEDADKAKEYFGYTASRHMDEYGSRATFEMAAIEYKVRNKPRSQYWLTLYLQRYPTGVYRTQAQRMLTSLQSGEWLSGIEGIKKPDQEAALFKYNKLSLTPSPHYWYVQGGWQYIELAGQEPAPGGGLKARNNNNMAGVANAGVGFGPWRESDMTAFGGYTYRQLWLTDIDRMNTYFEEPTDIEYFPLRGDLLERRHQFYGDFRRDFGLFFAGVYGRYEFGRIGSSIFPGPDDAELRKVLKISDISLIIPWIGAAYGGNMRTLAYLYLRKELNSDSPEHSNKSYDFGLSGEKPTLSLGISHEMDFPEQSLTLNLEAFRYEFIYNDLFLDYTRQGFFLSAEHELLPRWYVSGLIGYYQDQYLLPRLKMRSCGSSIANATGSAQTPGAAPAATPNACPRDDTGILYQAGVYWNWTQFQRFAGDVLFVENRNTTQREFEESKMVIQVSYTMAFPSVKRVSRYVDRYADTAFTKESE